MKGIKRNLPFLFVLFSLVQLGIATADAQVVRERPALAGLPKESRAIVLAWLTADCGAGEQRSRERRLAAIGRVLEPVFWEAYRLGPTSMSLNRERAHIVARYKQRQAWLSEAGEELFGLAETNRLLAVSEEQFVTSEIKRIVIGFRTAAVLGLEIVGTRASLPELDRIAADRDNPVSTAARRAAASIRERLE